MPPGPAKFARKLRFDRERSLALLHFTWYRFVEDRCMQTAGALAYTSVFALVPLTAAILGILAAFPGVRGAGATGSPSGCSPNFVPADGRHRAGYITEFAANASKATAVGILVLLFSAVALMMSIEDAFNRIWRVQTARPACVALRDLLDHAHARTVAARRRARDQLLCDRAAVHRCRRRAVVAEDAHPFGAAVPDRVERASRRLHGDPESRRAHSAMRCSARSSQPRCSKRAKRGFAWYATRANYQQVYGAIAIVPIFIFWIYLSWAIVLFGASLTASLNAFDYRPASLRLQRGQEFSGLLRVLGHFAAAQRDGRGLRSETLMCGRAVSHRRSPAALSWRSPPRRRDPPQRGRRMGRRSRFRQRQPAGNLRGRRLPSS